LLKVTQWENNTELGTQYGTFRYINELNVWNLCFKNNKNTTPLIKWWFSW